MKNYIKKAVTTESKNLVEIKNRISDENIRLLHGAIGLMTESGELLDQLKKHIFYGKELDTVNIKEECGDIFWYMAIICDTLGTTFKELQKQNIEKLVSRYGKKFSSKRAIKRNLEKERKILEKKFYESF